MARTTIALIDGRSAVVAQGQPHNRAKRPYSSSQGRATPMYEATASEPDIAARTPVAEEDRPPPRRRKRGIALVAIVLAALGSLAAGERPWRSNATLATPL